LVAPLAVIVTLAPGHNVLPPPKLIETVGEELTVMVIDAVLIHPAAVFPVTVYVSVPVGFAVTLVPVLELNPMVGVHVYMLAPLAVNVALFPVHMLVSEATTVTSGTGLTVIFTLAESLHPFASVPTTQYEPEAVLSAVTEAPVVLVKPALGYHTYVVPPLAFITVLPPVQIDGETAVAVTDGLSTDTLTVAVELHPSELVPVIVHVCVLPGLAVTTESVPLLKPVTGLHEYVEAPPAVNVVPVPPKHIWPEPAVTFSVGVGLTVIVIFALSEQPPPEVPITVYVRVEPGLAVTLLPVVALRPVPGFQI
jgi:hypothetical protein